jgi:hypothetical protein
MVEKKRGIIDLAFVLVLTISLVFMIGFVNAATSIGWVNITNQSGQQANFTNSESVPNAMQINQSIQYKLNFSLSHIASKHNLTGINITLPTGFTFASGSNGTGNISLKSGVITFSNTSTVLSWNASIGVINYTGDMNPTFFWFNFTASTPGIYNMTIQYFYNNTPTIEYNETGIQINVWDNVAPTSNFSLYHSAKSMIANSNHSGTLVLNLSVSDTGLTQNVSVIFNITNVTGGANPSSLYYPTNGSASSTDWVYGLDTSALTDGVYNVTAIVTDNGLNVNKTTLASLTFDNTDPTGTFTCSPTEMQMRETITCTCTSSDVLSGIDTTTGTSGTTYAAHPSSATSGDFTQTCTFSDLAGNSKSLTSNSYTIWGASSSSGSSSGSSSSTVTPAFVYSNTISQTSQDFSEIKTIQTSSFSGGGLAAKEKVTFKLGSEEHYVGVKTLTTSSATIEIASTPTQVILAVGEESKKDLNNDKFYDVYIKLNAITDGKADLTISYIHEEVPIGVTSEGEGTTAQPASNLPWTWIIVGLVVLLVLIGGGFALKKKRK